MSVLPPLNPPRTDPIAKEASGWVPKIAPRATGLDYSVIRPTQDPSERLKELVYGPIHREALKKSPEIETDIGVIDDFFSGFGKKGPD